MVRASLFFVSLCVFLTEYASGEVCEQTYSIVTYTRRSASYRCGLWGWGRCRRYTQVSSVETKTRLVCCPGSYGDVETNCEGECPYKNAQKASACPNGRICRDHQCDDSGVLASSLPTSAALTFNENDDKERFLWRVDTKCFVQESCSCPRKQEDREKRATCTCSKTVPCTYCTVKSTNGIADVRNGVEIYRKSCSNTTCSDCRSYPGCLDHSVIYNINIECQASGYLDNDIVQLGLTLTVNEAEKPTVELPPEANDPLVVDTNANVGDTLLTIGDIVIPASEKTVEYILQGPVSNITKEPLFIYNEKSQDIDVNSDLSQEPGGVYTLQFCIKLRRGRTCVQLVVEIERITTTSSTTTTTAKSPTTEQKDEYVSMCVASGSWKSLPGMDNWCSVVCGPIPLTCPYLDTHCDCKGASTERLNCTSAGLFAQSSYWKKYMDIWCDLNCNAGIYSNCPTDTSLRAYCVCD